MASLDHERLLELRSELAALERKLAGHVLTVVLPGNPGALKINNAKKPAKIGGKLRMVDDPTVKRAKIAAASAVRSEAFRDPDVAHAISEASTLVVEIDSYWPRCRHLDGAEDLALGDVDAPLKLTIDALEKSGLIDDDARVIEVRARKFMSRANPRIELRVMPEVRLEPQPGLPEVERS